MADKRIEEIKGKISYLTGRKRSKNDELDKLFKKLRRKKHFKAPPVDDRQSEETDNWKINFILNPIDNHYGSIVKYVLQPTILGCCLSFLGGYLCFSFNYLLGILIILVSFLFVPLVNCLEDRYLVFSKDAAELKKFQKFILIDIDSQMDVDQLWFTKEELLTLQSSLPWYLSEAEIESAAWLNSIIEVIWLQIHSQFNAWLDANYGTDRTLNALFGNSLLDLRITQSSLGN